MPYWVYMMASRRYGTLYVGVTGSVERRVSQHLAGQVSGFTQTYGVKRLVFLREYGDVHAAIRFEKQLKRWRRDWKVQLIEADNFYWEDLYPRMMEEGPCHPCLEGWVPAPH